MRLIKHRKCIIPLGWAFVNTSGAIICLWLLLQQLWLSWASQAWLVFLMLLEWQVSVSVPEATHNCLQTIENISATNANSTNKSTQICNLDKSWPSGPGPLAPVYESLALAPGSRPWPQARLHISGCLVIVYWLLILAPSARFSFKHFPLEELNSHCEF